MISGREYYTSVYGNDRNNYQSFISSKCVAFDDYELDYLSSCGVVNHYDDGNGKSLCYPLNSKISLLINGGKLILIKMVDEWYYVCCYDYSDFYYERCDQFYDLKRVIEDHSYKDELKYFDKW